LIFGYAHPVHLGRALLGSLSLGLACAPAEPPATAPPAAPPPPDAASSAPAAPTAAPEADRPPGPIVALTTSCAVLRSGEARCWEPVPGLEQTRNLVAIARGRSGTWTIDRAGAARCFGCEAAEQRAVLALGPLAQISASGASVAVRDARGAVWFLTYGVEGMNRVPGVEGAVDLSAGSRFGCAVLPSGRVSCWGDNLNKVLGPGSKHGKHEPTEVRDVDGALMTASGMSHTCTLLRSGRVVCWGHFEDRFDEPLAADGAGPADAVAITGSGEDGTTCAVRRSGRLLCWGDARRLGTDVDVRSLDLGLDDVERAAVSKRAVCAATRAGEVSCIGNLLPGAPQTVVGLPRATAVAVGADQTCALVKDGELWCWGRWDAPGRVDKATSVRNPRLVHDVRDAVALAMAPPLGRSYDGCVVRKGGEVLCWRGPETWVPGVVDATAVAVGQHHACALRKGGAVSCWGSSGDGELGRIGRGSDRAIPIAGLETTTAIAAGGHTTCALDQAGVVRCWGGNESGLLGQGTGVRNRPAPKAVPKLHDVAEITLGLGHACARRRDGRVACWGSNTFDEVSDLKISVLPEPVLRPVRDVERLAAGIGRTCVLQASGMLSCWGARREELDLVTPVDPPRELRLPDAVVLAPGHGHMCVLTRAGEVRCWGDDAYGQLGQGGGALGLRRVLEAK
jgi:alpha-tubulin suppressor-like RCC1 family protein